MGEQPRGAEGFEEAFDDLFPRAERLAYQILGNRAAAEDVAAEAMARTYLHWRRRWPSSPDASALSSRSTI